VFRGEPRILVLGKDGSGYPKIDIGKDRTRLMHILICTAFHGPKPSPDHRVRHLNDVKADIRVENLCWGTAVDNSADRARLGTQPRGATHSRAKITEDIVRTVRKLFEEGVPRGRIAKQFGISKTHVYQIANRSTWAHIA